jgi:hypothetical protein
VTSIGQSAFSGCAKLASVTIGTGVTTIGNYTFASCSVLASVTIPNSVTTIGQGAFSFCSLLASVTIGTGVTTIGNYTFASCSVLASVTIPNNVTSIGQGMFQYCSQLTSVTIPNSVTSIDQGAFKGCSVLASVTFLQTSNVVTFGTSVFNDTPFTTSATAYMYSANTSVPSYLKTNYSNVTISYLDVPVTAWVTAGFSSSQTNLIFNGNTYVANSNNPINGIYYYTGSDVTAVGGFTSKSTLVSVDIGDNVTSIDINAFQSCSLLASVTIGTGVTSIGNYAFQSCSVLASVTIGTGVTSIGNYAFYNCSVLTSVTFLQTTNVVSFGSDVFGNSPSTSLTSASFYFADRAVRSGLTTYFTTYYPSVTLYSCFLEGSKILTEKGYVKIEELKKGDLVKTELDGYKKVDMIGWREIHHVGVEERIKDQLYKCTKENYPEIVEELIMTGCHAILVDNFKNEEEKKKTIELVGKVYITGDKYRLPACADDRAVVYEKKGDYKVYHVALENDEYTYNYGIYANGLLVESCSKRYLKELSGMELL